MYAKDPYEAKYQYLINKRESVGINHFNDPKAFIEYSNDMRDVYKNINYYNPGKENKTFIVFDDMIADMIDMIANMLDWILLTFLSQKYRIKENFSKLQ